MSDFTLSTLETIIATRAASDDEKSYTRKLLGKGVAVCAKKLGEEAVETALAAVVGSKEDVTAETADLIYHLLVVLKARDVSVDDVMTVLQGRTGRTGLEEKASRPKD